MALRAAVYSAVAMGHFANISDQKVLLFGNVVFTINCTGNGMAASDDHIDILGRITKEGEKRCNVINASTVELQHKRKEQDRGAREMTNGHQGLSYSHPLEDKSTP